ncbi:MAG: bacteriohemerythrin [Prolixibacteraceae bacterium]|jgi:hemerythrin-like metal-binding protein
MLNWNEDYSVGIQSIDNQHKELISLLNRLLEAMKHGEANEVNNQILFDLEKYSLLHFQKEEYFFQKFKFAGSQAHIAEHQSFVKKIAIMKADLKSGKYVLTIELLQFLKNWIEHHILIVDKAYSEYFRQNGLK